MIAFVMSGGGNRGALEAGALLELFEAGIRPDMLVGTSAGALNAGFLATNPTPEGARHLADVWSGARRDDFFPGGIVSMVARLAQGRSLFPSDPLRRFAEKNMPADKRTFGDVKPLRLYITAANLNNAQLYLWGDRDDGIILDAVIASAAHPLAFPPVDFQDMQLVDGGVVANVPVGIAIDKGATEIYILNVGYAGEPIPDQNNIISIVNRAINVMMYQHFLKDLKSAAARSDVKLNHIHMSQFQGSQMWDLEHGAQMVEFGRRAARDYLDNPTGVSGLSFAPPGAEQQVTPPPGAEVYAAAWM